MSHRDDFDPGDELWYALLNGTLGGAVALLLIMAVLGMLE